MDISLNQDGIFAKNIDKDKIQSIVDSSKDFDYKRLTLGSHNLAFSLLFNKNMLLDAVLYFFLYSAIGWAGESAYCSVGAGHFVNRGFLAGPMCPIYGSGATLLNIILSPIYGKFGKSFGEKSLAFVVSMVGCDILEYITSVLMEKFFNARWWDYSNEPFNLNGRICLKHTMYWGVAGVVFRYMIHPFVSGLKERFITNKVRDILVIAVLCVFAVDLVFAILSASNLKKYTVKLGDVASDVADTMKFLLDEAGASLDDISDRISTLSHDTFDAVADKVADMSIEMTKTEKEFEKSFNRNVKEKLSKENIVDRLTMRHLSSSDLSTSVKNKFKSVKDNLKGLTDLIR